MARATISKHHIVETSTPAAVLHTEAPGARLGADDPATRLPDQTHIVFRLVKNDREGAVHLSGVADCYNKDSKRIERARVLSGYHSIWLKDQKDLTPEYIRHNQRSFIFDGKVLRIDVRDEAALEFLRINPKFVSDDPSRKSGGKHEYFEWNPVKQAELGREKQLMEIKAMEAAFKADEESMKRHALYLGVIFVDEVGLPKQPAAIRTDYCIKAKEDPKRFLETLESEEVTISYAIAHALRESKIDLGKTPGKAYWSTGALICSVPTSKPARQVLLEFATNRTEEGNMFKDQLIRSL